MTFTPTTLILDAMERATILVTVQAPKTAQLGQHFSGPLIVRGCLDHFARVDITIADCAGSNCCDIDVADCQDQVHHWYDHFYCARPCRNLRTPGVKEGRDG
jgi:hypothetical protein